VRPALVLAVLLVACAPRTAAERGEVDFSDPGFAQSAANAVSCATCHSEGAPPSDRILAGGSLRGALERPSYWNGTVLDPLVATNDCLYYFMRTAPANLLMPDDDRGRDLLAYLETTDAPSSPAVPFTVPATLPAMVSGGDATRGARTFAAACHVCHGDVHSGAGRVSSLVPRIPDETMAEHGPAAPTITLAKIRHGGFYGIGGTMPPFSTEVLDDAAVADVMAFLGY